MQAPPSWPVTCTATCYAAVTVQDVVTTGSYAADGPHFLDWKALAEHGNVSMAAVPMYSCNKPVAVLCLASKQVSFSLFVVVHTHVTAASVVATSMNCLPTKAVVLLPGVNTL